MNRMKSIKLVTWELNQGYKLLKSTLNEVSKETAQWKPSANARTLDTIKQWNKHGDEWFLDKQFDPLSTIEFKVLHLAQCKIMYNEYAFREQALTWKDLECPGWPKCREYLEAAQLQLVRSLRSLDDAQLEEEVPTNWGEKWPIKQLIAAMIHHDAYHLGQICMVRNLCKMHSTRASPGLH